MAPYTRIILDELHEKSSLVPIRPPAICMSSSGHRIVLCDSQDGRIGIRDGDTGQVLHSLEGHASPPIEVAMSGSGHRIVSCDGSSLKLWDGEKAVLLRTLAEGKVPHTICMSGNGRRVFTASQEPNIHVWDCESGEMIMTLSSSFSVYCLSVSWTGHRIVAGSNDRKNRRSELVLWDGESGTILRTAPTKDGTMGGQAGDICSVCMSRSGHRIALSAVDGRIEIWDGASLSLVRTIEESYRYGDYSPISITMSACGYRIIFSNRRHLEVWDGETGELVRTLPLLTNSPNGYVTGDAVSISASGHRISLVCTYNKGGQWEPTVEHRLVRIYDLEDGRLWRSLEGCGIRAGRRLCMSPSGKSRIVLWSPPPDLQPKEKQRPGVRRVWDGDTGELLHQADIDYGVTSAAMSHDGKRIVACSSPPEDCFDTPYTMRIIDGDTGEVLHTILDAHSDTVTAVCISPDGRHIVTASGDKTIKMWDGITGRLIRTLNGHSAEVTGLSTVLCTESDSDEDTDSGHSKIGFSHIISASEDETIKCWLAGSGELLWTIETGTKGIESLAADSELERIVMATQRSIQVWDGQTRKLVCTLEGNFGEEWFYAVRIDLSGRHFVSSGDGGVKVWDAPTGKLLRTLRTGFANALAMNSSGDRIAWLDQSDDVRVMDNAGSAFRPSPSDILYFLTQYDDLPLVIGHFDSSPSLALEVVQKEGHRRNLLLAVMDSLLVSAEAEGQQPPSLAWVERLMEAYPLVACAADPLVALPAPPSHGDTSMQSQPAPRTLLTMVLSLKDIGLVKAVLRALATVVDGKPAARPNGLPYYSAVHIQMALEAYPRETAAAMAGLWDLGQGPDRPLRLPANRIRFDLASGCRSGGGQACEWVWGGLITADSQASMSSQGRRRSKRWGSLFRPRLKVLPEKQNKSPGQIEASPATEPITTPRASNKGDVEGDDGEVVPLSALVCRIPGVCGMGSSSFLATCVRTTERLGDAGLFEKGLLQSVLDYKWESYGNRLFIFFGGASVLLAALFSAYIYLYTYSRQQHNHHEEQLLLTGLGLVVARACLGLTLLPLVLQEAVQLSTVLREGQDKGKGKGRLGQTLAALAAYMGNPWNAADALTYSGLVGVLALHSLLPAAAGGGDKHTMTVNLANILAAGVSLMLWLKLLYYFRGYQSTGVLVRAVAQITVDIQYFIVILFVFIFGFGNAFYLLCRVGDDASALTAGESASASAALDESAFGSMYGTFLSLFSAMTGNYDLTLFEGTHLATLSTVLYIVYVIAQAVIMLNLLIAIMGDSYDRIQEKAMGEWRREQAKIILELEQVLLWMLPWSELSRFQQPWLHVLREAGKEDGEAEGGEWPGRVKAIGREVRTLVVGIQDKLQAQLAKVESQNTQVEAQVSSLKTEVEAVRSDMRELKDMLARLLDNNPAATKPGGTTEEQVKELK